MLKFTHPDLPFAVVGDQIRYPNGYEVGASPETVLIAFLCKLTIDAAATPKPEEPIAPTPTDDAPKSAKK